MKYDFDVADDRKAQRDMVPGLTQTELVNHLTEAKDAAYQMILDHAPFLALAQTYDQELPSLLSSLSLDFIRAKHGLLP